MAVLSHRNTFPVTRPNGVRSSQAMNSLGSCCRLFRQTVLANKTQLAGLQASTRRAYALPRAALSRRSKEATAAPSGEGVEQNKTKALEQVMKDLNTRFGRGTVMQLGNAEPQKVECIPSGALTLDIALGGGFPKGRIVEVYGPESSGKTTLALHAMAAVQKAGGNALLVDAEHAFDAQYAKRLGLDTDKMYYSQPSCGEEALEVVDQAARGYCDIIVVDSVAALVPRAEIEGEMGAHQVGTQARLMSQGLRKLTANASKCNCTILFLNQLRHKVGVVYGNPEITSGGQALKFYASVRLEVRRKQTVEDAQGVGIGIKVKAKVVKNKCAPPYKLAEFDIMFGSGISGLGCLLDAAEGVDVVQRKGSWYSFGEQKLGQGRDKTLAILADNKEMQSEIEAKTRGALGATDINDMYDKEAVSVDAETEDTESDEALPLEV